VIAAVPNERYRVMTDSNPPWQGLQIFRHIEKEYGSVAVGSIYSMGLHGAWEYDENKNLVPAPVPHDIGVPMRNREELLRAHIDWKGKLMTGFEMFNAIAHGELAKRIFEQWKVNAMMIHLNRGCVANGPQKLVRLDLLEAGYPVCVYEGNVGDYREFDLERSMEKIDTFFDGVVGKLRK
jgi:benzoyl-CoA reductase subunit B